MEMTSSPSLEDMAFLEDRLYEFNAGATGVDDGAWLALFERDQDGAIVAGLLGTTWCGHCQIRTVWVHEQRRGRGLGRRLLEAATAEARRRGCRQIALTSHDFQAPDFYRKLGFVEFAVLEDNPRGHREIFLRKSLG